MKKIILFITAFLLFALSVNAQQSIRGDWEGAIQVQGQQLVVIFHIDGGAGNYTGTLDIPQQGATGLNLSRAEQRSDSVFFTFFTGQGDGEFVGTFQSDSLIKGMYSQGTASFPFEIQRQEIDSTETQTPGEGENIIIPAGEHKIGGTLVTPDDSSKSPLVILISGSGAQDRDSNVFGFKLFAELAEHFKTKGISSFRYDDRQVGQSTGSFSDATLTMLAEDVEAIIEHLINKEERFSEVILLGHSQGGIVAGKVAAQNELVDKLILMASTGIPLKQVLRFQVKQAFGEGIYPEDKVEQEITLREEFMTAIKNDGNVDQAKKKYAAHYKEMLLSLPEAQRAGLGNIDTLVNQQVTQLEAAYGSPQMQSLLFYDPTQDLRQVDVPVLVLFGGKDTQVTEDLNRKPIEDALKQSAAQYEIKTFSEANHLFQKANTGQVTEYQFLDKEFLEGFPDSLSTWILKK